MTDFGVSFNLHLCLSFECSVSRGTSIYAGLGMRMEIDETENP